MSYQVLARKWRPKQFSEVVGQQHIVAALSNALDSDRVHHAFLFTGTRGVGKTTLARIFAKALNCETGMSSNPCGECSACRSVAAGNYIDLIEVDAASRTKVDDTRDLLDNVQYAPTQGRYKVYLIDEVHMLSTHSFNALLKTLEEPPEHVKFLLATTDPQKLPMTILSRCIQFSLNAIEQDAISMQLAHILEAEEISHETAALRLIARSASGSMRDALSLLDQAIAFGNENVSEAALREMLGMIDSNQITHIVAALIQADYALVQQVIEKMVQKSSDFATAIDDLLSMLHAISAYQFSPASIEWKGFDVDEIGSYAEQLSAEQLQLYYQIVLHGKRDLHLAPDSRTGFEMALLRLFAFSPKSKGDKGNNKLLSKPNSDSETKVDKSTSAAETNKIEPLASRIKSQSSYEAMNEHKLVPVLPQAVAQLPDHLAIQRNDKASEGNKAVHVATANLAEPISPLLQTVQPTSQATEQPQPVASSENSVEPPAAPAPQISLITIQSAISDISVWSEMINNFNLQGMTRQLALHMSPQTFSDSIATVKIDSRYEQLVNKDRIAAIELQINNASSETVKLNAQLDDVEASNTAAGFNAELAKQRTEDTRRSFQEDPAVQEMVELFDATIDVNSIKQA